MQPSRLHRRWDTMGTGLQRLDKMQRQELWSQRIAACRKSGLGVHKWYEGQGLSGKTYYYWQRKLWNELEKSEIRDFVPVPFATASVVATVRLARG